MTSFSRWRSATRAGSVSVRGGRCLTAVRMLWYSMQRRRVGAERRFQLVQAVAQDQAVAARRDREAVVEVVDA